MTHRPFPKILILGGTTEARQLAARLAERGDCEITLSLAGRTEKPMTQPVPVRAGGFGGAEGLAAYLLEHEVALLIDATHPYAARISANAAQAAKRAGVPILALRRPGWVQVTGDRWTEVESAEQAVRALGESPRRVFLALGRQEVGPFAAAPQHFYLIRSVDPIEPALSVANQVALLARGPFAEPDEARLLRSHAIDAIVCKNSGGAATHAKIAAARKLGLEVIMIRRPALPQVEAAESVEAMLALVDHWRGSAPAAKRGV